MVEILSLAAADEDIKIKENYSDSMEEEATNQGTRNDNHDKLPAEL
jgi:hypothetical protein